MSPAAQPMNDLLKALCSKGELQLQGARVDDGPYRGVVIDKTDRPLGVMFLSNPVAPGLAERCATRSAAAKKTLGPDLSRVILNPILQGEHQGTSYTLWPWCQPLRQSRICKLMQRNFLGPGILSWLHDATAKTSIADTGQDTERSFAHNLQRLAADDGFPEAMRDSAKLGMERIADGSWTPSFVFQHGDFWMGNVLCPQKTRGALARFQRYPFTLIDWPAAHATGFPFVDLLRFSLSTKASTSSLHKEVAKHCKAISCKAEDAQFSLLAAFGHLGTQLEHYSRERYLGAGARMFHTLNQAT